MSARAAIVVALTSMEALACGHAAIPAAHVSVTTSSEPLHDTIGEYRQVAYLPLLAPPHAEESLPPLPPLPSPPPPQAPRPPSCANGMAPVYVVTDKAVLYGFDPSTLTFTMVARLGCAAASRSGAGSMAVDRTGRAVVRDSVGGLMASHVAFPQCAPSSIPAQPFGTGQFGMAFAPVGEHDALFIASAAPARLGSVSADGTRRELGAFPQDLTDSPVELSSLPDGRLFGLFAGEPSTVAEIDPATAALKWRMRLPRVRIRPDDAFAFAFAAVGEDFYFFTAAGGATTAVTRLRKGGTLETVLPRTPLRIVGAGVPTCVVTPLPQSTEAGRGLGCDHGLGKSSSREPSDLP